MIIVSNLHSQAGVWYACHQLKTSREVAQLQFEDALSKEYRELAGDWSKRALLGDVLSDGKYEAAFDELYRYVNLTNEQISLRMRGRITPDVWRNWTEGMQANLKLPAFARAWDEVKARSSSFQEPQRLEGTISPSIQRSGIELLQLLQT